MVGAGADVTVVVRGGLTVWLVVEIGGIEVVGGRGISVVVVVESTDVDGSSITIDGEGPIVAFTSFGRRDEYWNVANRQLADRSQMLEVLLVHSLMRLRFRLDGYVYVYLITVRLECPNYDLSVTHSNNSVQPSRVRWEQFQVAHRRRSLTLRMRMIGSDYLTRLVNGEVVIRT
jgi:hypothetical protein